MNALDALDARYSLILCDIWGCVHDGANLYPGAAERLLQWRQQGRTVILISNAPRTVEAVTAQLDRIGLPREAWDGIATSGEAGIAALRALGQPVGFIGTQSDREILEGKGVVIADRRDFAHLACTGLEKGRPEPSQYAGELQDLAGRQVVLHCLNPDRVVVHAGVREPCAGALADLYERAGGQVEWYGKPYPAIYRHALALAGTPTAANVLAIGDSLQTDMLGAARMGFDCIFVAGGIHAGKPFPPDFGREHGLGNWEPIAVVDSLG